MTSKVKLRKWLLTALMTSDIDHIHIINRYRQGQHTLVTSRSQGQCQGHEGRFRVLAVFTRFCKFLRHFLWESGYFPLSNIPMGMLGILDHVERFYYQRWLNIADPTSLDVLVVFRILDQLTSRGVVQYCRPFAGVVQITMRDVSRIKPNVNNATCWGT